MSLGERLSVERGARIHGAALQWPAQFKTGRGPDSEMKEAPMKLEPKVIAASKRWR